MQVTGPYRILRGRHPKWAVTVKEGTAVETRVFWDKDEAEAQAFADKMREAANADVQEG